MFGVARYRDVGPDSTASDRSTIASIIQAIGIQVFSRFYKYVAVRLTQVENWRTETEYEDILGAKLFAFNFINSYFALIVLVFSDSKKTCDSPEQCTAKLQVSLLIIFAAALLSDVFDAAVMPQLMRVYNQYTEGGFKEALSAPEWQFLLSEYDETLDSINAYMALTIQFGYVALFSTAAPFIGIAAALLDATMLRLEARKYLTLFRRIEPRGAEDIGRFEAILTGIGVAAAITNAAIVVRLNRPFDVMGSLAKRRYVFVISAFVGVLVQLSLRFLSSPRDHDVHLQLERQDFLRDKIINKIADEEERIHVTPALPDDNIAPRDPDGPYTSSLASVLKHHHHPSSAYDPPASSASTSV